jgi:hypothetical protein
MSDVAALLGAPPRLPSTCKTVFPPCRGVRIRASAAGMQQVPDRYMGGSTMPAVLAAVAWLRTPGACGCGQ